MVTENPSIFRRCVASLMSDISLPISPINIFFTYATCDATEERKLFNFVVVAFKVIF